MSTDTSRMDIIGFPDSMFERPNTVERSHLTLVTEKLGLLSFDNMTIDERRLCRDYDLTNILPILFITTRSWLLIKRFPS